MDVIHSIAMGVKAELVDGCDAYRIAPIKLDRGVDNALYCIVMISRKPLIEDAGMRFDVRF